MTIADDMFHSFIDEVGQAAPAYDGAERYYFQEELNEFIEKLQTDSRATMHRRCDGIRTNLLFSFTDGSVLRFADAEQVYYPCYVDVVKSLEQSEKEMEVSGGVLVKSALALMTIISEKSTDEERFEELVNDIDDAISNIQERFERRCLNV